MKKVKTVHTEHCCIEHGCKYNKSNCPVYLGYHAQSYPCELCNETMPKIPDNSVLEQRRLKLAYMEDSQELR